MTKFTYYRWTGSASPEYYQVWSTSHRYCNPPSYRWKATAGFGLPDTKMPVPDSAMMLLGADI